jgi:hypothetical protein
MEDVMTPFAIKYSEKKAQEFQELKAEELVWISGGMTFKDCTTTTICENEGPNCPPPQCDTGD